MCRFSRRLIQIVCVSLFCPFSTAPVHAGDDPKPAQTLLGHTGSIMGLAFSPDGKTLASASSDRTVKLWDVATGKVTATLNHPANALRVAYTADGKTLVVALAGIPEAKVGGQIWLWDVAKRERTMRVHGFSGSVVALSISPDGKKISAGALGGSVAVWEIENNEVKDCEVDDTLSFAFSPNGKWVATESLVDECVYLWAMGTPKHKIPFKSNTEPDGAVAFSPDSKLLAVGTNAKVVQVWEANTGRSIASLKGHTESIRGLAFSPNSKWVASGSKDMTVRLWDVASGKLLVSFTGVTGYDHSLAFSPDGLILATGGRDKTIKLWKLPKQ